MTTQPVPNGNLVNPSDEDPLRTVEYVASVLSFPEATIRDWLRSNRLRGTKVAGQWRVLNSELIRFVNNEYGDNN